MNEEQLAFDIEGMLHEARVEAAPEWTGARLHFTTAYYSPNELDAALEHWQFLHAHDKTHVNSRMWRHSITVPESSQVADHGFVLYTSDLRCEPWKHADRHESCACVGELMYQAICETCEWNGITDNENEAVEMWHDHALPGWRDLQIVPSRLRLMDKDKLSKPARQWISQHYPKSMQVPGGPIITERRRTAPDTSRGAPRGAATTSPTPPSTPTASSRARSRCAVRASSRWSQRTQWRRPASASGTESPEEDRVLALADVVEQ
ncbi:hypothetical protein GCM10011584_04010 [Nocardioides phosphati]|uniref:Uncharacterized protein n=1 Tax=Nocardioides phosphati TaxID=1867775 RepID=A0ABQ2N6J9_9ACTN|nr:DUF6349 family protein [Nocardioides phosphati]GGO85033.1 hypothetical protein GCM10011584_04010 [Nocardioides phosphati]